jgi:hypothetical protein
MKKILLTLSFIIVLLSPLGTNTPTEAATEACKVLSGKWSPSGDMDDNWFKEGRTTANMVIKTIGCVNTTLNFSVFESDLCGILECDDELVGLYRKPFVVPSDNFTISINLGEDQCETIATGAIGYDCQLFFYIRDNANELIFNSWKNPEDLFYECDGICDTNPSFIKITPNGNTGTAVDAGIGDQSVSKDTYKLLAPIGDLECIENGEGTSNPNCTKGNVGTYINIFFKIAIGLAGALAVIMIVIHSVSYMGDESVFGKTEAKSSILSAIGGLLLALGAYALLNTIDPALTGSRGIQIDEVVVELDEEPIIKDDPNITIQKGAIARCPEGVSKISTRGGVFYACNSIAPKFKDMVNKAWAEGIQISGGGFRTRAKQEALRAKNCGGSMNIYNKKAVCNPQTALPGTSMHESGLAFDLACEGKLINTGTGKKNRFQVNTSTRKCFDWLNKNAGSFGLKNLPTENWHWSTTGK